MIIADASILLEMIWRRPAGNVLAARLCDPVENVHVPYLTDLEVASSLRLVAAAPGSSAAATEALVRYRCLRLRRHAHAPLFDRVWELRKNLTPYDAVYVALAEWLDAPLLTCDRKLAHAPGNKARIELVSPPLA